MNNDLEFLNEKLNQMFSNKEVFLEMEEEIILQKFLEKFPDTDTEGEKNIVETIKDKKLHKYLNQSYEEIINREEFNVEFNDVCGDCGKKKPCGCPGSGGSHEN